MPYDFFDQIDFDPVSSISQQYQLSVLTGSNDKLIDQYAGLSESECNDDGIVSFFKFLNENR